MHPRWLGGDASANSTKAGAAMAAPRDGPGSGRQALTLLGSPRTSAAAALDPGKGKRVSRSESTSLPAESDGYRQNTKGGVGAVRGQANGEGSLGMRLCTSK